MDSKLLEEVKRISFKLKGTHSILCGGSDIKVCKNEAAVIYEIVKKDLDALYKVNEEILASGSGNYEECRKELKPLITNLLKLCVYFMKEQELNIAVTEERLKSGDSNAYFKDKQIKNIIDREVKVYESLREKAFTEKTAHKIKRLTDHTKLRYTKSFGMFKDSEEAKMIIQKEYTDVTQYIKLFLTMKVTVYERFDNYDILITGLQNIVYELIQLSADLDRAAEMKAKSKSNEKKANDTLNAYFVIMDGVESTRTDAVDGLIKSTISLNQAIVQSKKIIPLCKFKTYKQDEIQGLFAGDIEEFLKIVDKVYSSKVRVAFAMKLFKHIRSNVRNIQDSVYGIPFDLYGDICSEARENIKGNYLILGGKGTCRIMPSENGEFGLEL